MKKRKLATFLLLTTSLVGCTEGHKISRETAVPIIKDIIDVVSSDDFEPELNKITIHSVNKTKSSETLGENSYKGSSSSEVFLYADFDNNFFSMKTIVSRETVSTENGNTETEKSVSMTQVWHYIENNSYITASESVNTTETNRYYYCSPKEEIAFPIEEFTFGVFSNAFNPELLEYQDALVNDPETAPYICEGYSNDTIFKSNQKDGNFHSEYKGQISEGDEGNPSMISKVSTSIQIDNYFIIEFSLSYTEIVTSEERSSSVKRDNFFEIKFNCKEDKPNLKNFTLVE